MSTTKRNADKKPKTSAKRPTRAALRREIRQLAREFADELVATLDRNGMWDDSAVEKEPRDPRSRIRRSLGDLEKVMTQILADLRTRKEAVSIGKVAATLGLTSRQVAHPMSLLVEEGKVTRTGERRGARYKLAPAKKARKKATTRKKKARPRSR